MADGIKNCRNAYAEYFDSVTVSRVSELSTIMEMGHLDHPVAAIGSAMQVLQSSLGFNDVGVWETDINIIHMFLES